jgi:hypothetical protein
MSIMHNIFDKMNNLSLKIEKCEVWIKKLPAITIIIRYSGLQGLDLGQLEDAVKPSCCFVGIGMSRGGRVW